MKQAVDLYTSFREKRPTKLARLPVEIPKVVAAMGHVEAIDYRTTHGGKVTLYRHKFTKGSRPILAVSGNGKQLMLLGGHYAFTDRGIVDHDARGREKPDPKHGRSINPKSREKRLVKVGTSSLEMPMTYEQALRYAKNSLPESLKRAGFKASVFVSDPEIHGPKLFYTINHGKTVNNPKRKNLPPLYSFERRHFLDYAKERRLSRAVRGAAWKLFLSDPEYWANAGWPPMVRAAETA